MGKHSKNSEDEPNLCKTHAYEWWKSRTVGQLYLPEKLPEFPESLEELDCSFEIGDCPHRETLERTTDKLPGHLYRGLYD